jgi:hypothetical protein
LSVINLLNNENFKLKTTFFAVLFSAGCYCCYLHNLLLFSEIMVNVFQDETLRPLSGNAPAALPQWRVSKTLGRETRLQS